jgi:enamine deaminase RidA (YjgF/YER057c/UK114 family)
LMVEVFGDAGKHVRTSIGVAALTQGVPVEVEATIENHRTGDPIMALQSINPKDLPVPKTYIQVVVAIGSKLVFISGREPEDIDGKLVGRGDLEGVMHLRRT